MSLSPDNVASATTPAARPTARPTRSLLIACALAGALSLDVGSAAYAEGSADNSDLTTEPSSPGFLPEPVAELTVSPLEGFPGDTVHVEGICTLGGHAATEVSVFFLSEDKWHGYSVTVPNDPITGRIGADITVPATALPGPHTFGWMCIEQDMAYGYGDDQIFTILDNGTGGRPTTPPVGESGERGKSETVPGITPLPTTEPMPSKKSDRLAATGLPDPSTTLTTTGILTAAGTATVSFLRRRTRQRSGHAAPPRSGS